MEDMLVSKTSEATREGSTPSSSTSYSASRRKSFIGKVIFWQDDGSEFGQKSTKYTYIDKQRNRLLLVRFSYHSKLSKWLTYDQARSFLLEGWNLYLRKNMYVREILSSSGKRIRRAGNSIRILTYKEYIEERFVELL